MEEKNKDNPKYQIIANYVKDLSFEIPSPDCFVDVKLQKRLSIKFMQRHV